MMLSRLWVWASSPLSLLLLVIDNIKQLINSIVWLLCISGYLCCVITVLFFAAPCCMLMQVFRKRSTDMLPLPLIFMSFLVSVQWFAFGVIADDVFLQIPNFLGAILSGTQLLLFCIYPNKPRAPMAAGGEVPYVIF